MTNNQKEAISILNRLRNITYTNSVSVITEEEYYLLLEYIVPDKKEVYTYPSLNMPILTRERGIVVDNTSSTTAVSYDGSNFSVTGKVVDEQPVQGVDGDQWAHYKEVEQKPINDTDKEIIDAVKDTSILDMVEPKFKVGDFIVDYYCRGRVVKLIDDAYLLDTGQGIPFSCEHNAHLWTIQDAKDGDLIYVSTSVKGIQAIFHKFDNGIIYFHCYLCKDFTQGGLEPIDDVEMIYPLQKTNYQRFFQKMEAAGYEWDAENKELKKIEQKPVGGGDMAIMLKRAFGSVGKKTWGGIEVKDILTWLEIQDSQKPTTIWHNVSEVPDEMQELLVEWESPDATWHNIAFYDVETKAFRHLKQPINNVTRWAYVSDILTQSVTKISDKGWSEEDEKAFEDLIGYLNFEGQLDLSKFIVSLKQRLGGK